MTCRSRTSENLGDIADCLCFPSPSCTLFPRRPDGRVTLPNPLTLARGTGAFLSAFVLRKESLVHPRVALTLSDGSQHTYHPYPTPLIRPRSSSRTESDPGFLPPENAEPPPISPGTMRSVDNYAQLSSLPEFRAFKLNQNGRLETRRRANTDSSVHKTKAKPEWMEEIRVTRRTKKQAYVRSGTHDFCIRLYSLDKNDKNKD